MNAVAFEPLVLSIVFDPLCDDINLQSGKEFNQRSIGPVILMVRLRRSLQSLMVLSVTKFYFLVIKENFEPICDCFRFRDCDGANRRDRGTERTCVETGDCWSTGYGDYFCMHPL